VAVTIHQQPPNRFPVYNNNIWLALSNQIAQPNFVYRVVVTDIISSVTRTYDIPARPDGYCVFDSGVFAELFMTHFCPINQYGWLNPTGIRQIRVNIGEFFGTPAAYTAGTNIDKIVWNAVQDYLAFPSFNINDYQYDASIPNFKFLTGTTPAITYADRSDLLYVLTAGAGDLQFLFIDRFDKAGGALSPSIIVNPFENPFVTSTNYREKYLCIDVGLKGLANISAGLVTGAYPIVTSNLGSYLVSETNSAIADPARRLIRTYTVGCTPRFPVYTVHYLKKNGAFETLHFNLRSDFELQSNKTTFKQYPFTRNGSAFNYSRSTPINKTLASERDSLLTLNTDWLTPEQADLHQDLIDSPLIYLDLGSTLAYPVIELVTGTYKLNKAWNENLFQLSMQFKYAHQDFRQRI
jgi:hypothetical protein